MTRRAGRFRTELTVLVAWSALAGAALVGAGPAGAAPRARTVAPGIQYSQFDISTSHGVTHAHLVTVDLRNPHVSVGLLHPGVVAARAVVSRLADAQGAVAGINGDFFNISETQHRGVEATNSAVGPAVANGRALKAAVPRGQRFGPALPPGTTTEDVLGVGTDRTARLDRLSLTGSVTTPEGQLPLRGLNQYALPQGSIGAYTSDWGSVSRARATCGTDTNRGAPCSNDAYEVTIRNGRVVAAADAPGRGAIARGTTVLVGREAGAQQLRKLFQGEEVQVQHRLVAASSGVPYLFAIGGFPVLRWGAPLSGLDDATSAVRTAVGTANGGRHLLLLATDGAATYRNGLTVAEVASVLRGLGATDGFNLDGGGSTTLVTRERGASTVTVRNHPSGGAERPVADGIGVFSDS
ncbi:phosphodiester glycosidase family protein [Streptomyces chiangmaiensis]|uniref:Phosphodiester glycosidase family protein n=1 Tax=Streptomyces chiangmaiensis TaxID=766497 RepID=A0ABU7FGT8_9ACTN|nr:phosphodiester glycosidase family protein [Streptomyces chiangmaiensis]MED7823335.1 phosphodiester glycosidase family protein [Streptomyces chiangmaiensis]